MNSDIYLLIKSFHIIAIITWMVATLYLPRLFVYHASVSFNSPQSNIFEIMERRLEQIILVPSAIIVPITGIALAVSGNFFTEGWFHLKLLLVLLIYAYNIKAHYWRKSFAENRNNHSARFYRIANEVPTLLLISIVILAVVKPF